MTCVYCGKPATGLDLCHALHPVCDLHQGLGHQIGALPREYGEWRPVEPPKKTKRT